MSLTGHTRWAAVPALGRAGAILLACSFAVGPGLAAQERAAPSVTTWEQLRARPYPAWFRDAKLGIFIHWGVYSVPAYGEKEQYGEWFLRGLDVGDTLRTRVMRQWYGEQATYRDLAPRFRAELFDPAEWADLFARAGARYVVLVSKHHDGYALWPSRYAPGWNSVDVGPGRDIVGELSDAVRAAGLRMGLYYSLAEWNNPLHRWYLDPPDSIGPYVERHLIPQFRELISTYRPAVLFADGEWLNTAEQWHARELIAWYYVTVGDEAIVNDRWGAGSDIGFRTPEYSAGIAETERPWTEVRGLGRSFGLNRNEKLDAYLSPGALVRFFAGLVADGGGLILNVGPAADGQIPLLQQERLVQLGDWLAINGEAIYGSRPWARTGEWREVTLDRVDPAIDFDWVRNSPGAPIAEDDFTAEWAGFVAPRFGESYTFTAEADDGIRVWVADTLVFDGWEGGEPTARTVALLAGERVPIRVEYREGKQNASARLFWSSPSQPREIVPTSRLSAGAELSAPEGLRACYRSRQRTAAYTTGGGNLYAITFEWPDRELALPIPAPPSGTRVSLLGRDGDLPWRHAEGTLFVDLSGVPYREIPGAWAWTVKLEGYDPKRRKADP
jgi:alpha-L-fucosidase